MPFVLAWPADAVDVLRHRARAAAAAAAAGLERTAAGPAAPSLAPIVCFINLLSVRPIKCDESVCGCVFVINSCVCQHISFDLDFQASCSQPAGWLPT